MLPPDDDFSRGAIHKRLRFNNRAADIGRYNSSGIAPEETTQAIERYLQQCHISLADDGPDQLVHPPMPGVVVLLGDELFIGRQHLPLLAARLRSVGSE